MALMIRLYEAMNAERPQQEGGGNRGGFHIFRPRVCAAGKGAMKDRRVAWALEVIRRWKAGVAMGAVVELPPEPEPFVGRRRMRGAGRYKGVEHGLGGTGTTRGA